MFPKKENRILFLALLVITFLCFAVWYLRVDTGSEVMVISDTPEWDLRAVDFSGDQFIRAKGSVAEYVPNALLTPAEFENANYIVGRPKNAAQYLTSRFRLLVPDGRVYALMTHSVDYADRIYINGQLYQEIGHPAERRADMTPQTLTQYYTVAPENGVIEIVQQVSNFVHREGGNPTGFRIGSIETTGRHYNRTLNMAAVTVGCCLLLFLMHMVLFLMQTGYRANLFLSLFCLVMALQVSVSGARLIAALFPRISWEFTFRVGYLSVPLTALLAALALDAMFEGLIQKPVKLVAIGLMGLAGLLYILTDTVLMSWLTLAVNPLCILLALYVAGRLLWRLRQKDKRNVELTIVLCGVAVLAYALLRDTLYHNNILILPMVSANLMDFSVLVFVLFQMTASFHGTMRQVRRAMERQQMLAAENAALDRVNQMKNELMANLTHELRTPLTVMSAYAQLTVRAVQKGRVDEKTAEDLKLISNESKRLADMASNILGVIQNREVASNMTPYSLASVVEQVGRLAAPMLEKNKNMLVSSVANDLPPTCGQADECMQLLWNLLSNANAHMRNGVIHVSACALEGPKEGAAPMLAVTVTDNGTGISPELLPHIFERNASGSQGGAGLGLAICREVVQAHGGEISVESTEGEGTTVRFTLPALKSEEMP